MLQEQIKIQIFFFTIFNLFIYLYVQLGKAELQSHLFVMQIQASWILPD